MYIYADNAATTKTSQAAIDAMVDIMNNVYGNPSSLHTVGQKAKEALEKARVEAAQCLGADFKEIYFTSGGSEADNQAIISAAKFGARKNKKHIISTKIEHHAVLHTLNKLEKEGFDVNENILLKELISFIELTIKDLPVKEKERILKKYVQCKTLESIAIEENCSIPAVYYSIKIALEKIKEVLIKNGYDIND